MHFIIQWIDLVWLPLAWLVVNKEQRWWALGTLFCCMLVMRLEIELMESIGHSHGILGFIKGHVRNRALVLYSLFYGAYLLFAWYSPFSKGYLFMAASLGLFFMALFSSMLLMLL
jgi:hypothetical protein